MGTLVEPVDIVARCDRLASLLSIRGWNSGSFDGTIYGHALPVFEALYRYGVRGRSASNELQVRKKIEQSIHTVWRNHPVALAIMMGIVADIVAYTAKLEYPISEWTKQELFDEFRRTYKLERIYGVLAGVLSAADVVLSAAELAMIAGLVSASRATMVVGGVGVGITVLSTAAAGLAYLQVSRARGEIEEEIEKVRIPNGTINRQEWEQFEYQIMDGSQ